MKTLGIKLACAMFFLGSFAAIAQDAAPAKPQLVELKPGDVAPAFTLKDMKGKTVSLADYKGKVVVLDFWATWCGPCKASFPGMQMAVDKYKNDPNVVFLFADISERVDNYTESIASYLETSKYRFNVIAAAKADPDAKKMHDNYGVRGIPTKFIIDKAGIVYYTTVGFNPNVTPEGLAEEVAQLIEKAKGGDKNQTKTE